MTLQDSGRGPTEEEWEEKWEEAQQQARRFREKWEEAQQRTYRWRLISGFSIVINILLGFYSIGMHLGWFG